MTATIRPDGTSTVPWLTSDPRVPVPDLSPSRAIDGPPAAAAGALTSAMPSTTDPLRETRDAPVEGVRTTVRRHPLVSVAAALALGAVIARIARIAR